MSLLRRSLIGLVQGSTLSRWYCPKCKEDTIFKYSTCQRTGCGYVIAHKYFPGVDKLGCWVKPGKKKGKRSVDPASRIRIGKGYRGRA